VSTTLPPLIVTVPVTLADEFCVGDKAIAKKLPALKARFPAIVIAVPGVPAWPGANVPPELITAVPTLPVPVSVPPVLTLVRDEAAIDPSISNMPALILVAPV
jgi:hypothetical protein